MSNEKKEDFGIVFNKHKRRRPARFRINWEEVKYAYIYAEPILHKETNSYRYPTLEEIGEKYELSMASIAMRATKERPTWYEQRKMYHNKMKQLHNLEYGVMSLRRSSEYDSDNLRRLDQFSKVFDVWLNDLEDQIVNKGYRDEEVPPMGIRDMKDAMSIMKDMHQLNRNILGEPINYYEFYKERAKEDKRELEKGKTVTRHEIRDLISAVRKKDTAGAPVTLDVSAEEENSLRIVSEVEDDDCKE